MQLYLEIGNLAKDAQHNINEDKSVLIVEKTALNGLQTEAIEQLKPSDKPGHVCLPLKSS